MPKPRPALFKWRALEPEIIVARSVGICGSRFPYRDIAELLMERSLRADHTTISRCLQCYAPELNKRCRRELKLASRLAARMRFPHEGDA